MQRNRVTQRESASISIPEEWTFRTDVPAGTWVTLGGALLLTADPSAEEWISAWLGEITAIREPVTRTCPYCGTVFPVGPGTGHKADAIFCSPDHRVAFNSLKRSHPQEPPLERML